MTFSSLYQLENLLNSLLEAINDQNSDVQESVSESLIALGRKKAQYVFKIAYDFTNKNLNKLNDAHKTLIFNTVEKIVKENISELNADLAQNWIVLTSNEMISPREKEKENPIVLQTSASNLLVAIGKQYVKEVFDQLQKNFTAGQLPHIFVINTMAYLAEINPYGVVPNLTGVLTSMLPMLGMAKTETYKGAFASALCKFSEAILYYCSNKDKAPDQSIEKTNFSSQIYAAYEIFFNIWMKTSDQKLRQLTIESIGYMVNLMSHDKLEADIAKIMPGLLGLYKKHSDHFIVSQSIYLTVSAVVTAQPTILNMDNIFEPTVKELFAQIVYLIELQFSKSAAQSNVGKSQNEVLRIFAELAKRYSDRLLPFLLQKFEQNNEKNRIASLSILKHLINSCGEQMTNKKQLVISGVRIVLNETNPKVKNYLIQTIISMAYHGYLQLEGGNSMIEFILKQASLPVENEKKQAAPDDVTNEQLRSSAENVITLFSTTVENMHSILWPALFEYLNNPDYTRATTVLCKNLAHIAEQKRTAQLTDYVIKYDNHVNIPKPYEILVRLIVLCGVPLNGKNRGLHILNLMKNMSPNIDSTIVDLWDNVLPKLTANLEDKINNSKYVAKTWEDLIMKLLSNSLDQIANEDKLADIAKSLGKQIETLYVHNSTEEKCFAYKCMGLILSKTTNKTTIDRQLDVIFNSVNHTVSSERESCAISFGYTASSHLDSVLLKLETYAKNETKKSGGGILSSILKDGSSKTGDPEQIKSTLVLAYGYVTNFSPKDLIISRLEANILRSVSGYATNNIKDLTLKQSLLKSLDIITKCMHQDHLQKDFNFSYRNTIMNQIITYISSEPPKLTNDVKSMCFKICSNIVKLNPKPTEADLYQLIKTSTDSFYPLPSPVLAPNDQKPVTDDLLHGNELFDQTSISLDDLLKTILDRDMTNNGLNMIFKHVEPWITSVNEHERLRSMKTLTRILKHFASNFKPITEHDFGLFGHILGRIVSRSTDPSIPIRTLTVECIEHLIAVIKSEDEIKTDKYTEQLAAIHQKLVKTDSNVLLSGVNELSKIICKLVPQGVQLITFIEKLIDGLLDVESHCSSASCLILNYCIKLRGAELKEQVENLIKHLYTKLSLIQNSQSKLGTLRTLRVLFQQHLNESLNVFLTFPIPCNNGDLYSARSIQIHEELVDSKRNYWLDHKFYNTMDIIDICQSLCEDSQLVGDILDHVLQLWNRCMPYEEKNGIKYASLTPLIATCILTEIFSNNSNGATEQVFVKNFEKLFTSLLVRVSSTLNTTMPYPKSKDDSNETGKKEDSKNSVKTAVQNEYKKLDPCKLSIECFKCYIKCSQSFELFEYLNTEKVWDLLGTESTHVEGCTVLAKGICKHADKNVQGILQSLSVYLSAPYDCQKITVTAYLAELMNHECCLGIVDSLMNSLLTKLIDQCHLVRTLCLRGLGNMSSLGNEQVQKNSTTILSAMMAGLDDKDDLNDDITLESMNGLTKIIAHIDENNVRPILINILLRIRPCFEKDKPTIRASSYNLFGELARFGQGPSKDPYLEQIHSNFVSFILHLNEQNDEVKRSCKNVLKHVGPLMESNSVNELFQASLVDGKSLHYGEFINDLSKLLVNEFPDKVSFYIMNSVSNFKSQWTEIRANAVLFAGYMLGFLSKDKQTLLSKEHISNALIKLLKEDSSPLVRKKAAEAISLLSEF